MWTMARIIAARLEFASAECSVPLQSVYVSSFLLLIVG